LTERYEALCAHYRMTPSLNNCGGIAHENGSIESAHGHIKNALRDALLLRGSAAFDDVADYRRFVAELVSRKNRRQAARIEAERAHLQSLPEQRACD
jgi:hypothetical protein